MPTSTLTIRGDIGGIGVNSNFSRTATGQILHEVTLKAGIPGDVTRTGNRISIATPEAGHGISIGSVLDLYWHGGRRYNVDVIAVQPSDATCECQGGAGDDLPPLHTPLTVTEQQTIQTHFVGNLLVAIGALCVAPVRLRFYESLTLRLSLDLTANEVWFWVDGGTAANPLAAANVTHIVASQWGEAAASLEIGALYNSA